VIGPLSPEALNAVTLQATFAPVCVAVKVKTLDVAFAEIATVFANHW
jgi:hypothetical protein